MPDSVQSEMGDPHAQPAYAIASKGEPSIEGAEGICFTAGLNGAPFAAGVIHAYLVSHRKPPAVVAGISMGSLSAAAMQRCYKELERAKNQPPDKQEAARWRWFRDYVTALYDHPLGAIWDGLPHQSDFFADLPPVSDPTPELLKGSAGTKFKDLEAEARRELYLLVKLGNWLASLPITVRRFAALIVTMVRAKEKYPGPKWWRLLRFYYRLVVTLFILLWHLCFTPKWFPEHRFVSRRVRFLFKPFLNWEFYPAAWLMIGLILFLEVILVWSALWAFFIVASKIGVNVPGFLARQPLIFQWPAAVWWNWLAPLSAPRALALLALLALTCAYSIFRLVSKRSETSFTRFAFRPLFGWPLYIGAWHLLAITIVLASAIARVIAWFALRTIHRFNPRIPQRLLTRPIVADVLWQLLNLARSHYIKTALLILFLILLFRITAWLWSKNPRGQKSTVINRLIQSLFKQVELEKHLVHDFHLRIRLTRLFGGEGISPNLDDDPVALVLVVAPLQSLRYGGEKSATTQFWAPKGKPLIDALCASLAVPGLFSPLTVEAADKQEWLGKDSKWTTEDPNSNLDLVDGSVIRRNPIPALFGFLKKERRDIGAALSSTSREPKLHIVYEVPLGTKPELDGETLSPIDIVDVGLASLKLARRRDTDVEVLQTNFTSQLERETRVSSSARSSDVFPIFADEIAPDHELSVRNPLSPDPNQILGMVAEGCRQSLSTLYRSHWEAGPLPCQDLFRRLRSAAPGGAHQVPGLPEVCSHCTMMVGREREKRTRKYARPDPDTDLSLKFTFLDGTAPRIIFLASGGVFRGAFHAGMLASLLVTQIRPQLIVGASVGTLMGGALGAMFSATRYDQSLGQLNTLVHALLHLDECVAFTKTLKNATRELGVRGRAIPLSPNKLRKLIREGARSDPGFAETGAPSALIDAISDLLMIPHRNTARIAAHFVSGHVARSVNQLLSEMKKETLDRLDIKDAVIGTSLLENLARTLLGGSVGLRLDTSQPYRNIAFCGTTTNLNTESTVLLGRYRPDLIDSYDFVQAALASSAFPCVFRPRKESEIFPGKGRISTVFSDGGLFDNLPFIPALGLLADVQRDFHKRVRNDPVEFLRARHKAPDLFVVGSLDAPEQQDDSRNGPFDDIVTIGKRGKLLQNNVKITSFQESSNRIHRQLDVLLDPASGFTSPSDPTFVNGIVDAGTLAVYPSNAEHLNPTFAFCASTGFQPVRVRKSIADGCFQTFAEFLLSSSGGRSVAHKSVSVLIQKKRIPSIELRTDGDRSASKRDGLCPFFLHSTQTEASHAHGVLEQSETPRPFTCPFFEAARGSEPETTKAALSIYRTCVGDQDHQLRHAELSKQRKRDQK